jgi:hypothetical protein
VTPVDEFVGPAVRASYAFVVIVEVWLGDVSVSLVVNSSRFDAPLYVLFVATVIVWRTVDDVEAEGLGLVPI